MKKGERRNAEMKSGVDRVIIEMYGVDRVIIEMYAGKIRGTVIIEVKI